MRQAPKNLEAWPKHLRFVFVESDKRAASAVVLISYETLAVRTLKSKYIPSEDADMLDTKLYWSEWRGGFAQVILDEG